MADELTVSLAANYLKSGVAAQLMNEAKIEFDISGTEVINNVQSVGFAAEEAVTIGDVTGANAHVFLKNLDATNYVTVRLTTGAAQGCYLAPNGGFCYIRPTSATFYMIADTAACRVWVGAVEA